MIGAPAAQRKTGTMRLLTTVIALFAIPGSALLALEAPPKPGAYQPSLLGTWMSPATAPAGALRIGDVGRGPLQWMDWSDGDLITLAAGSTVLSAGELCLVRDALARLPDGMVLRSSGGERAAGLVVGIDLNDGRLGSNGITLITPPSTLTRELPALPGRIRAAILAAVAKQAAAQQAGAQSTEAPATGAQPAATQQPDMAWLECLLATRLAAGNRTPPPVAVAQPLPFLDAVLARWRVLATLPAGAVPEPVAGLDHAAFNALFDPCPENDAPLGQIALVPEANAALQEVLLHQAPPEKLLAAVQAISAQCGTSDTQSYIKTVCMAVLDPVQQGGWPFRMTEVSDPKLRARTVAELDRLSQAPDANQQLLALARLGPAVMDHRWPDVETHLTLLATQSPWLAIRAIGIAGAATGWYGGPEPLLPILSKLESRFSGSARNLVALAAAGRIPLDTIGKAQSSDEYNTPGNVAIAGWEDGAACLAMARADRKLAPALLEVIDQLTNGPGLHDGPGAWFAAQQAVSCGKGAINPKGAALIAAAAHAAGNRAAAVAWQQAVIARARGNAGWSKAANDTQALYLKPQEQAPAAPPEPLRTRPEEGGLTWSGVEREALPEGLWTAHDKDGHLRSEIWMRHGDATGRYRLLDAAGHELALGLLKDGVRIGWQRIALPDGGRAEGWYDGDEGGSHGRRTGWWRIFDAAGTLRMHGLFRHGEALGHWRTASGEAVTLPPPLPGTDPVPSYPGGEVPAAF